MTREPDGRRAFVVLLCGIVAPGSIEKIDREIKIEVNRTFDASFPKFSTAWLALQKAAKPSVLIDFNPAGSVGTTNGWSGTTLNITKYDIARLGGDHRLPSAAMPSNPKAFVHSTIKAPGQFSSGVSAALLARTIGITEGDRRFVATLLTESARRINKPKVTPATLAQDVFNGVTFADVLNGGELPDRDDFKERFVKGLDLVLKKQHGQAEVLNVRRADYSSGPLFTSVPASDRREVRPVPTTACLGCHGVRADGKARFVEPLPALAFDPFDKQGREAWLKTTDGKRKIEVLTRMLKRVVEDKDMPPEDATEYDLFRLKDAASFDEVKRFLESSLKKAKG